MNTSFNTFNFTTSPLDQFEIRDLVSLDLPVLANLHLSLTNIGLDLVIAFIITTALILLKGLTTWFKGWGLDTRYDPNHQNDVPSNHYDLYLVRRSSGAKQYISYTGAILSHVQFKATSMPFDLVTDHRPYSRTYNQTLFACEIATRNN